MLLFIGGRLIILYCYFDLFEGLFRLLLPWKIVVCCDNYNLTIFIHTTYLPVHKACFYSCLQSNLLKESRKEV